MQEQRVNRKNLILLNIKYIESFVWMINHAGNRRLSYVSDKDYELM